MYIGHGFIGRAKEKGDTIIEVLIAIAVISLVLGGAYVTTHRSLLATRGAEERVVGLKLVESQLEQIKGLAKVDPNQIFGASTPMPFCINQSGLPVSATNAECQVDANGAPTANQPQFILSVNRAGDGHTFTVTNQWTDVAGKITDNIQMVYRVYE